MLRSPGEDTFIELPTQLKTGGEQISQKAGPELLNKLAVVLFTYIVLTAFCFVKQL